MVILFFKKKFSRFYSTFDIFQVDSLRSILPVEVEVIFSSEKALLEKADIVVIDLPFISSIFEGEGELVKRENQLWVAWNLESEINYPWMLSESIKNFFDIWMTYHLDADVVLPYFNYSYKKLLKTPPTPKSLNCCMFISSHVNSSHRFEFLSELMRYIPIDSYGAWKNNCTIGVDRGYTTKLEIMSKYKFTVAFENALQEDYVTEKFFDPLIAGSVPLYYGAPNIELFSPGENSYLNVRSFESPKVLADIIMDYCKDERKYSELIAWKFKNLPLGLSTLIDGQKEHPLCRLIALVQQMVKPGITHKGICRQL